jgi:hypothetical protein
MDPTSAATWKRAEACLPQAFQLAPDGLCDTNTMTRHAFAVMYSAESGNAWSEAQRGKWSVGRRRLRHRIESPWVLLSFIGGEELQKQGCTSHLPVSWLHPGIGVCVRQGLMKNNGLKQVWGSKDPEPRTRKRLTRRDLRPGTV